MRGYRDLKVWQLGFDISLAVYELTSDFPQSELYGPTSQLRRAAVSIPSNIAEGHSRSSTKDLIRFINMAKGSLAELETQLLIARSLGYCNSSKIDGILELVDEQSRMLSGYRRSLKEQL